MDKGDPRAAELLERVMATRHWDRDQLADHVGKKRRTIDGIMRGELSMAHDLEKHLQLLLEPGANSHVVRESEPPYEALQHVIFIERAGTPEQISLARSILKTIRDQVEGKPDQSGDKP